MPENLPDPGTKDAEESGTPPVLYKKPYTVRNESASTFFLSYFFSLLLPSADIGYDNANVDISKKLQ